MKCLIEGCDREADVRGLCKYDYNRWRAGRVRHPDYGVYSTDRPNSAAHAYGTDYKWGVRKGTCKTCGQKRWVGRMGHCKTCWERKCQACVDPTDDMWLCIQADDYDDYEEDEQVYE